MQNLPYGTPLNASVHSQFKPSSSHLRKSLDIFESRMHTLIQKQNSNYKPIKKSMLNFKEGLYYIHKLCQPKSRVKLQKISKSASPKKKKNSLTLKVPKIKTSLPAHLLNPNSEITIIKCKTPVEIKQKISPKLNLSKTKLMSNSNFLQKLRKQIVEYEDLKGWAVESYNNM